MGVEWDSTAEDAWSEPDEELADPGSSLRIPRWLRRVPPTAWALLAIVVVGGLILSGVTGHVERHPVANLPVPAGTPAPTRTLPASVVDDAVAVVRHLALQPEPLAVYIRAIGTAHACPLVAPGTSPQRVIRAAMNRILPAYVVDDVGYTLDPFSALCALQVRARDAVGSVLVVNVVAPQPMPARSVHERLLVGAVPDGTSETAYAFTVTSGGWTITVATTGAPDDQASTADLRKLAEDPAMRW